MYFTKNQRQFQSFPGEKMAFWSSTRTSFKRFCINITSINWKLYFYSKLLKIFPSLLQTNLPSCTKMQHWPPFILTTTLPASKYLCAHAYSKASLFLQTAEPCGQDDKYHVAYFSQGFNRSNWLDLSASPQYDFLLFCQLPGTEVWLFCFHFVLL